MFYYLIIYILAISFAYGASKLYNIDRNKTANFLGVLIVILLSVFAGLRSVNVGTDVNVYVIPNIDRVESYPDFLKYISSVSTEPNFSTITFINGKISKSPFLTLFISQLLTIAPFYITLVRNRDKISITASVFVYCFFIFSMSLCIMRQLIASSLAIFAFFGLKKNKILKFLVLFTSFWFHYSVIIFILISFLSIIALRKRNRLIIKMCLFIGAFALVFFLPTLLSFLTNQGILDSKYFYAYNFINEEVEKNVSYLEIAMRFLIIIIPVLYFYFSKSSEINNPILLISIIGFVFSLSAFQSQYFIRISYPFYLMIPLLVSLLVKPIAYSDSNRFIYTFMTITLVLSYWVIIYMNWNYFETAKFEFYR